MASLLSKVTRILDLEVGLRLRVVHERESERRGNQTGFAFCPILVTGVPLQGGALGPAHYDAVPYGLSPRDIQHPTDTVQDLTVSWTTGRVVIGHSSSSHN